MSQCKRAKSDTESTCKTPHRLHHPDSPAAAYVSCLIPFSYVPMLPASMLGFMHM